jgi:uncharacterized protein (DUF58 family)
VSIKIEELSKFRNLEFLARKIVEGFITGLHRSPFHGFSVEFAEHRQYRSGESSRFVDWKLYARTDKLFVKRFEEETNLRCFLVVDASPSMYYPERSERGTILRNKASFSAISAAALSELMRRQRDASGLYVLEGNSVKGMPAKMNQTHQRLLFHELDKIIEGEGTGGAVDLPSALHQLAERLPRRSVVVLFSDLWAGGIESAEMLLDSFRHLRHNKHEIIVFHVTDKKTEQLLDLPDKPYRFVDLESGVEIKAHSSSIRKHYQDAAKAYMDAVKLGCARYGAEWVEADISEGFDRVLWAYLLRRKSL